MSECDIDAGLAEAAVALAEAWQNRANELLTNEERGIQEQMQRLVTHPPDKIALTKLIDQSFRAGDPSRVANQVDYLLREYGVPDFFSTVEKLLVQMFMGLGRYFPSLSVPKMIEKMRQDSSRAIIPGEPESLYAHLRKRREQGVRMNINHLGEALLGEKEAKTRLTLYSAALKDPEIECISVKISTIYSQINPLAFAHTLSVLKDRLSKLYRTARENEFIRKNGTRVQKFVYLDMEEYRDVDITTEAFLSTLEQAEFKNHRAGIALQAYLPDSFDIQKRLTGWAKKRVSAGGSPIVIRIVKGANMEMERVESALHRWPLAPYDEKLDTDANFKRMVEFGMAPENTEAVRLGIASHNLFELAYAYKLAQKNGVIDHFSFEMLEGMADHVCRAICETTGNMLLYAPVATRDQFINAIAYLIRRLDENTAPANFLRYSFHLETGSPEWRLLKDHFVRSIRHKDKPRTTPHRTQNRLNETFAGTGTFQSGEFVNEPDTDWSLPANRRWAEKIRKKWEKKPGEPPEKIPVVVAGEEIFEGRATHACRDLSNIRQDILFAVYALAGDEDIHRAVAAAKSDPDGWREKSQEERHRILSEAAREIRRARGDLIGAAAAETGKMFGESDPEVSEAVDFAEFYPFAVKVFADMAHVRTRGKGVGVVISPWNFPIAIPCGGIAAALAAGNTVIFKPSSAAVATAWQLCQCFWRAGISKRVLQFAPCSGASAGSNLTRHPDVDFIILTGGTETGLKILKDRPDLYLAAETGGKNATYVSALSDRDQAVKNVIQSAFGNGGQKCSATSLLILEKEVYEDPMFQKQLRDAAESFLVGSAWEFKNRSGPLIQPPAGPLLAALTRLEPGETWLLKPQNIDDHPYLWSPGIKWNVRPGSATHLTEFFGPLLAVLQAEDLDQAVFLANQTGYGLTSGLESLDDREQQRWKEGIRAGNLYINRGTTGAVVLRQPFGGMGKSALGAGIKVGYFNYVTQFMEFEETAPPPAGAIGAAPPLLRTVNEWENKIDWGLLSEYEKDLRKTIRAVKSYLFRYEQEFSGEKDYFHLRGQDNIIRYLPIGRVVIRLHPDDSLFDALGRLAAARISGCTPVVSVPPGLKNRVTDFWETREGRQILMKTRVIRQSDEALIEKIPEADMIRYAAPDRVPSAVFEAAAQTGFYISRSRVLMEGRIELIQYLQEQSVCINYHRYGNLGARG
jgi:RHH-type proline utilization regulon transcriptional repressor/proline dehydrogenase/delta 1-pyrroline-5-carboxylate dehydrogenase